MLQEEDIGDLELPDDLKLEEGEDGGGDEGGEDVDSNDGSDGDAADEPQDAEEGEDDEDGSGEDENAPVELEELEKEVWGLLEFGVLRCISFLGWVGGSMHAASKNSAHFPFCNAALA